MTSYKNLGGAVLAAVLMAMPLLASATVSSSSATALGQMLPATMLNGGNTLALQTTQGIQIARSRGGFRSRNYRFHRRFRSSASGNVNRNRNSRLRSFRRSRNIRGGSRFRSAPVQNIHRGGRRFFGFRSINHNPRGRR